MESKVRDAGSDPEALASILGRFKGAAWIWGGFRLSQTAPCLGTSEVFLGTSEVFLGIGSGAPDVQGRLGTRIQGKATGSRAGRSLWSHIPSLPLPHPGESGGLGPHGATPGRIFLLEEGAGVGCGSNRGAPNIWKRRGGFGKSPRAAPRLLGFYRATPSPSQSPGGIPGINDFQTSPAGNGAGLGNGVGAALQLPVPPDGDSKDFPGWKNPLGS